MMSGAMILRIAPFWSVESRVGMSPKVVPLLGSTSISGTGRKGAVEGFSQLSQEGLLLGFCGVGAGGTGGPEGA